MGGEHEILRHVVDGGHVRIYGQALQGLSISGRPHTGEARHKRGERL